MFKFTNLRVFHFFVCDYLVSGSHTSVKVATEVDRILTAYNVSQKVRYAVTDNAANMKRAFTVSFPTTCDEETNEDEVSEMICEEDIWETSDAD